MGNRWSRECPHWTLERVSMDDACAVEIMHSDSRDGLPRYPIRGLIIGRPQIAGPLSDVYALAERWVQRCHDYDSLGIGIAN